MYGDDEGPRAEKPYCREQNANERKRNTKNQRKSHVESRITAMALSKLDLYKLHLSASLILQSHIYIFSATSDLLPLFRLSFNMGDDRYYTLAEGTRPFKSLYLYV